MTYICLPARNIYDKQNRVAAHRHTPAARDELRKLAELAPRLRELHVARIVSSDLDGQSAELLARRLNVPYEEWESLRRWNWGKWHGATATKAYEARPVGGDPQVPIKGGDSQASFGKRIAATAQHINKLGGTCLLIADAEVLDKLFNARKLERYHIYEVELEGGKYVEPDKAQAVVAQAAGRCCK